MARHPELQVEAERVRRTRQEEEQASYFSHGITHARSGDGDVVICFGMKRSQRQGADILFKILVN
jgi:hypothetical protein